MDARLTKLQKLEGLTKPSTAERRTLGVLGPEWMIHRARMGAVSEQWMKDCERHLARAIRFFSGKVGFSEGSAHQHYDITPYLEVHEMAEVLRFLMEEYQPTREDLAVLFAFEVIATAALAAARRASVLSLWVSDIDFDRNVVTFVRRSRKGRRSKVPESRTVPLFPQLRAILLEYLHGPHAPTGKLLFSTSAKDEGERPVKDLRRVLNRIELPPELAERARQLNGEGTKIYGSLSFTMLRHTYCTARLQTLDHGRPIAKHTVAAEMGHGTSAPTILRHVQAG